ncbi:hypothetical protein EMPS_06551 [Entomortierella parvispora]|uniref:NACHT domain-containing protein n=1 Tax=Entomortierella parvispora TaxID=205924 RepID=A0A9P3HD76_9FUNG|nr:hypothetical protein EMPS_06551 [Entomortierella parvispora]
MPPWYKRTLPSHEAIERATAQLEKARHTQDRRRAQKYCDDAKEALGRLNFSKITTDRDHIIAIYREHARILEKVGLPNEAKLSYSKAEELGRMGGQAGHTDAVSPVTPPLTPPTATLTHQPADAVDNIASPKKDVMITLFTKDYPPPIVPCDLPQVDDRLVSTHQLAYCLALLQASPSTIDELDPQSRSWLTATEHNQVEKDRLQTLSADLIRALVRDELKDMAAITEIMCLASVLSESDFRILLNQFVSSINDAVLMDIHAMQGLTQLIQGAPPGYMDADDMVKILSLLSTRLQETFQQSPDRIYQLTLTVSPVLDAMADYNILGLNRVKPHGPLLSYLERLKSDKDPYIVFQAACAYQALQCVPDDEEPWQAVLRRSGSVIKGIGGLAGAIKSLDIAEFIESLNTIQDGLEGANQIFGLEVEAYNGVSELKESGQSFLGFLKEGFSFSRKRQWYAALRGIDALLLTGEFTKLKILICSAPCRRELAFQWGVCQRLGNLAVNTVWDEDTRKDAVAFLGEIYRNDVEWGQIPPIKQYIVDILIQLAYSETIHDSPGSVQLVAGVLLKELGMDGDVSKRALFQACRQAGSSTHPWKTAPPMNDSSVLLDQVQNKPYVETALRMFQRRRLQIQEQRHAVYIPPQAKATREAPDDNLFDMTAKVKGFLASGQKVFLIMGDSGSGKSTFNMELELDLWKAYDTTKKRIPIFVTLPAIDKPEKDVIGKQLQQYDFTAAEIQEIKAHHEVILICDGYDECQKLFNLYNDNRLNQPGEWKAKMIISCRSEYLGSNYRLFFQPGTHNHNRTGAGLQVAVIAPFSLSKIRDYVRVYVEKHRQTKGSTWRVEDYMEAIDKITNLRELARNPFLLSLALEVLPRLAGQSKKISSRKIARVTLYDEFVEQWVERGQMRLIERGLTGNEQAEFSILSEDDFNLTALYYMKDLAAAIFEKQEGKPVVQYSALRDRATWKADFFGHGDGKRLLHETCPLIRNGNQYQFIHRSVMEYGVARSVFEPEPGDPNALAQLSIDNRHKRQEQEQEQEEENSAVTTSVLYRKSLVGDPSILEFLAERVAQSPRFKRQLFAIIEQSKMDSQFSQAASNAISILVRAGVRFNGADLKGARIPGADLSYGEFDTADFQGADLRNTTLSKIWLRQADLGSALMEGADFGELPYLQEASGVNCCAVSPDGSLFASGLINGSISVYSTATWRILFTLKGHADEVRGLAFSANNTIVSAGDDRKVLCWDAQSGARLLSLEGHTDSVHAVLFSPCCKQIASGSWDGTIRIWNSQTGALERTLKGPTGHVECLAFSPDVPQIVSGSADRTIRLWNTQNGELNLVLKGHTDTVCCVAYSPNGQQIVSGSWDRTIRLWNAHTGTPGLAMRGHTAYVVSVMFSPDGQKIASSSWDESVRLWDAKTGAPGPVLSGHSDSVPSIVYLPNGRHLASGGEDGTVRLWSMQKTTSRPDFRGHITSALHVKFSPDSLQVAATDGKIGRLWDARTGIPGHALKGHTDAIWSIIYSPNGQQVATASLDKTVRLWNVKTGKLEEILSGHSSYIMGLAYSPDGQQVATAGGDTAVRVWDVQTGECEFNFRGHTNGIYWLAFSPDGQYVASSSLDTTVRLWCVKEGGNDMVLKGHTSTAVRVGYSPNGQQIVSVSMDKTARLWDATTGAAGPVLSGHTGPVWCAAYSPDGLQVATSGEDGTIRLWDTHTGAPVHVFKGHRREALALVYSPDGKRIASGGHDGTIRVWDIESGRCLAMVAEFLDIVRTIDWKTGPLGSCIVSGSKDKSVRQWAVVEEGENVKLRLMWSSNHERLVLTKANFQSVEGLSDINARLLRQRGAVVPSST